MSDEESQIPDKLLNQFRRCIDALDSGNVIDAEESAQDIFFAVHEESCNDPSPDLILTLTAQECEDRTDWIGAEAAYTSILTLPNLESSAEYKAHSDLRKLCGLLNRDSDELAHARRATAAARCADLTILLAMAIRAEARTLIRQGYFEEARRLIAEALAFVGDEKMYSQQRAGLLTMRAECFLRDKNVCDAEADLANSLGFLQSRAEMKFAAGLQCDLAHFWSVRARLHAARNEHAEAIRAWQEAVSISKHVASLPYAENAYTKAAVAKMLQGLSDALSASDTSAND